MYKPYHIASTATSVDNWGYKEIKANPTSEDYEYEYEIITELSDKIMEAREMSNRDTRTAIYAECLTLIMDLAVELPTYQRNDLVAYNKTVIDSESINQNPNFNAGVLYRIWELNYV